CRPAGSRSDQESACARIRRRPYKISHTLKTKNRIEDIDGKHWNAMVAIGCSCRNPRRKCAGLADSFFKDLTLLRFFVEQKIAAIFRFITLACRRIDSHLAEERLHSERPCLISDDWN